MQNLQALKTEVGSESPPAESRANRLTKDLLADKDRMQRELNEAESMLKTIGSKGRVNQPAIADRARETNRLWRHRTRAPAERTPGTS